MKPCKHPKTKGGRATELVRVEILLPKNVVSQLDALAKDAGSRAEAVAAAIEAAWHAETALGALAYAVGLHRAPSRVCREDADREYERSQRTKR